MFNNSAKVVFIAIFAALFFSGCMIKGKVTGGGWIEGVDGGKANYGFNGAQCERGLIEGNFNYRDKKAGVAMNGEVTNAVACGPEGVSDVLCELCIGTEDIMLAVGWLVGCPLYQVEFSYDSKNPKEPGEGIGFACVMDCGGVEDFGENESDYVYISAETGPFSAYTNADFPEGGNIQAHDCTCTDGIDNDGDGDIDDADVDCVDANDDEDVFQEDV